MDLIKWVPQELIKIIQLAIKLLILVIFLGYIMIWILMPTNTFWLHWLPAIHAKVNSTDFGEQGANILIYTFPVLLIATLGCLCLELDKHIVHTDDSHGSEPGQWRNRSSLCLASWRKPALVKGPLGIVSWIELALLSTFFTLLIWSISAYIHAMFKNITKESATATHESIWEVKLESAALLLGLTGNIALAFLFFPVTRGSSILRLIGLSSETSIKYHIWLGNTVMILFTAHGLCCMIFWVHTHQISEMLKWNKVGISNVAGEVALLTGIIMWITSFPSIRRRFFELFFYTHHLYILFVVFFILHVSFSYFCILLPSFYLFLIDRYLRFLQSQQRVRLVSARVLSCQVVELNFSKAPGLNYNPASSLFLNVKCISKLQWHPFTVTSNFNMDQDELSIIVKSEGSWSYELYEKLSSPTRPNCLEVSVEGPYGPPASSFSRHDMLVMISGGSGITPFISIIRELIFISCTCNSKLPRILLVAAFKKSSDLAMLDLLLPIAGTIYDISRLNIQIDAYVTQEKVSETGKHKPETVWFKPRASDKPASAFLGTKNWFWLGARLGAIISSSFAIFLLLLGILTRYYIYPVDHNTNVIYSYPSRSILGIVFLCASIVITATIAFIWNQKQNIKDMRQVQIMDTPTASTSPVPETRSYMVNKELESPPTQSLDQLTTVHHGQRPHLKKILMACKDSNVRVLVSGPKKMKQAVAAICSSSWANNLNFEAFSFSW